MSTIIDVLINIISSFWETESRVSPNKKNVYRKRIGRKCYIKHPMHLLGESQVFPTIIVHLLDESKGVTG